MSYDLILQTRPDRDVTAHDFDTLQEDIGRSMKLSRLCEVTPGRYPPNHIDVLVLNEGLDLGDFTEKEFAEFCTVRGLTGDRQNATTAAAFVRHRFGLLIATFKLPTSEENVRAAYSEILQLALRHGLRIIDPQRGKDVDLQKPGFLPPEWNT